MGNGYEVWPSGAEFTVRGRLVGAADWISWKLNDGKYGVLCLLNVAVTNNRGQLTERVDVLPVFSEMGHYNDEIAELKLGCGIEVHGTIQRRYEQPANVSHIELRAEPSGLAFYPDGWPGVERFDDVAEDDVAEDRLNAWLELDAAHREEQAAVLLGHKPIDLSRTPEFAIEEARQTTTVIEDERPPALGPTTREYLVKVTLKTDSTAPTPLTPDVVHMLAQLLPDDAWKDTDDGEWYFEDIGPGPVIDERVVLDACNPEPLIAKASDVYVRHLPRLSKAPGCDQVELLGPKEALVAFIAEHWDMDYESIYDEYDWLR